MAKNGPKSAKMGKKIFKKIDVPYNKFPQKAMSFPKMHKKKIAFGEKKFKKISRLRREFWSCVETPPAGGQKNSSTQPHILIPQPGT